MSMRSRKETLNYRRNIKQSSPSDGCVFCSLKPSDPQHLKETKSFKLIQNIFTYSHWDYQDVKDHIMVVPKKHTDTLSGMTASESVEFMDIIGSYEMRGYNIWARAPQSTIKSIRHQHTHLIKPGKKTHSFVFWIKRPYFRIIR